MNDHGIDQLITDAAKHFRTTTDIDNTLDVLRDSADGELLLALYSEQEEQARLAALATKNRGRITKLMQDLCPDGATITIEGEELFARRIDSTRAINVKALKEEFPDTPDNLEFWTTNIVTKSIWAPKRPGGAE